MKKYLFLVFLFVFAAVIAINAPAFALDKPTEAEARQFFEAAFAVAARKNFFNVANVKKNEGQNLNINGVQFYKMYVNVELQFIWDTAVCSGHISFLTQANNGLTTWVDNSGGYLEMMRQGDYQDKRLKSPELNCMPKIISAKDKLIIKRELLYEEFESGYKLANTDEALRLSLKEKYLVGEDADTEIKRMGGLSGVVARSLTGQDQIQRYRIKEEMKGANKRLFGVKWDTVMNSRPGFSGVTSGLTGKSVEGIPVSKGWVVEYIGEDSGEIRAITPTGAVGWIAAKALEEIDDSGMVKTSAAQAGQCMTFLELQRYVDNNYKCDVANMTCDSGKKAYKCVK